MVLSSCGMLGARLLPVALCTVPIMGLGNAFGSVGFPLISRSVFGERDHAAITGVLSAVNGVGSTIGPILCGLIFDLNGSYYLAYLAMAVLLIPLGTLMVCAMHKHTQDVYKRQALPHAARVCRILPAGLSEGIGDYAALSVACL